MITITDKDTIISTFSVRSDERMICYPTYLHAIRISNTKALTKNLLFYIILNIIYLSLLGRWYYTGKSYFTLDFLYYFLLVSTPIFGITLITEFYAKKDLESDPEAWDVDRKFLFNHHSDIDESEFVNNKRVVAMGIMLLNHDYDPKTLINIFQTTGYYEANQIRELREDDVFKYNLTRFYLPVVVTEDNRIYKIYDSDTFNFKLKPAHLRHNIQRWLREFHQIQEIYEIGVPEYDWIVDSNAIYFGDIPPNYYTKLRRKTL